MSLIASELMPFITPETKPFWDSVDAEKPKLPYSKQAKAFFFPPSNVCPKTGSRDIEWRRISGAATLYSFMIAENPWPQWGVDGPMSVAHVALAEGPNLISTVVDCQQTPQALRIDMPLQMTFRMFGERKMLCFRPDRSAESRG